ncbi:MAG: bifunctional phosphopantothenoylcysteine decarboxylase/phosphopantothenate--cysteine ligase CoaBC [Gammaproteobacteria bacterium]|nr:bifunctional phosphopantothenoylcysteine decarboxylase/phosphopantothenate--cysteine ligase CoaBC [Gammaproteobacteria bacterium]
MNFFHNKNILLGVTGGIAAYKSVTLVRRLKDQGANVQVIMTESAQEFVTALTFQAISGNPVHTSLLDPQAEAAMGHIELARWADAIVIAPATANSMARLAGGEAGDLLTAVCLASKAPVALAPAMNQAMWSNQATQKNLQILKSRNIEIFGPAAGQQACGDVGEGRMLEAEEMTEKLASLFKQKTLSGIRVMLTAGPTREAIDPVRYISNHSSGKMGYAIAHAALEAGASVELVSGPCSLEVSERIQLSRVESAAQMLAAVQRNINEIDIFIAVAAVADYRPRAIEGQKIKKHADTITLELVKNPDILAMVASLQNRPFCVGFAAETENLEQYAKQKLESKQLDMIVANRVDKSDSGFNSDYNSATVFSANSTTEFEKSTKTRLATELIGLIASHYINDEKITEQHE